MTNRKQYRGRERQFGPRDRYDDHQQQQFEQHGYRDEFGQADDRFRYDQPGQMDPDFEMRQGFSAYRDDYGDDGDRAPRPTSDRSRSALRRPYPDSYAGRDAREYDRFTSNDMGGRDFTVPRRSYGGAAMGAGAAPAGRQEMYGRNPASSRDSAYHRDERGFFEKAGDEVASWFGDEEASRRREMDHTGNGPSNYTRSDERILEDVCDHLTRDWAVDARNMQVSVQNGEVTLDGTVPTRSQKRRAEDCADDVVGVGHIQNNLRVQQRTGEQPASRESES